MPIQDRAEAKRLLMVSLGIVVCIGVLSVQAIRAAEKETITVQGSLVERDVVLVGAQLNGKKVQLGCFKSVAHCNIPNDGTYLLVKLAPGKGAYMDCVNVSLYEKSTASNQAKRIGQYCLLNDEVGFVHGPAHN